MAGKKNLNHVVVCKITFELHKIRTISSLIYQCNGSKALVQTGNTNIKVYNYNFIVIQKMVGIPLNF